MVNSFTDQKARRVTQTDIDGRWGGGRPGEYFRCGFCGYKFKLGDSWRWIYTNDTSGAGGNPNVCEKCDDTKDNLIKKWKAMHEEADGRMWWFCKGR